MKNTLIYLLLFSALAALFFFLPQKKKTRRAGLILLALALLSELFVFNFHSFTLLGRDVEESQVDLDAANVTYTDRGSNGSTLEITEIDQPIQTLYLDLTLPSPNREAQTVGVASVGIKVDACDETQQGYYRSAVAEGEVIRGNTRSAYLVLNLTGNVSALRIRMTTTADCTLNAVRFNAPIPMQLSPLRLLLIVGLFWGFYALCCFPTLQKRYDESRVFCRRTALIFTAGLMLCAVALTFLYQYDRTFGILSDFRATYGNQISQELVDAFEAGQVSLLQKPPQELLELENPYDWSARTNAGISYLWDHLLFEGEYYSYYGIAPVLLLFLPYHLLTGYYFPTPEAVLLFGALGILFLSLLYLAFCDLFAKKIPANMVLCGLLVCQLSSGVWYNFCSPLFYEIAQASGFCFTCAGWYLLLRSGVIGEEQRVRPWVVFFATVCLALAVLCRPTLALYCIAALVFLVYGWLKYRRETAGLSPTQPTRRKLRLCGYIAASVCGFAVLGGLQMWYNYARFGSIMDFGIQYSLTVNDFTRSQYYTDFVAIGLHNFLFAAPNLLPQFPYVFSNFSDLGLNGYYFIANRNAVGIFYRALPSCGLFLSPLAYRSMTRKERIAALCLWLPVCVLVPLGIIFSIWESGYGVRYCADFAWQMILGGIAVLYLIHSRMAQPQTRRILQYVMIASLAIALLCNFGMIWSYLNLSKYLKAPALSFARLFDFWK